MTNPTTITESDILDVERAKFSAWVVSCAECEHRDLAGNMVRHNGDEWLCGPCAAEYRAAWADWLQQARYS